MRFFKLLCITGVALGIFATPASATSGRTIAVSSTFMDHGFLTGFQTVRCGIADPSLCEAEFKGHSTSKGTMTGFEDYTAWAYIDTTSKAPVAYAYEKFTGTVTGCGTGTFEFVLDRATETPNSGNPALQDLHGHWYFLSGSGTGDLARIVSGSGTEEGTVYPDTSNSGTFKGQLVCR